MLLHSYNYVTIYVQCTLVKDLIIIFMQYTRSKTKVINITLMLILQVDMGNVNIKKYSFCLVGHIRLRIFRDEVAFSLQSWYEWKELSGRN